MRQRMVRLAEMARLLDADYFWLYWRLRTGQAPVPHAPAYTREDMDKLRLWSQLQEAPPFKKLPPGRPKKPARA